MIENKVNHTKQKPNYFIFNHWFSKSLKFNVKKVNHTKQNNYSLIEGIIAVDAVSLYPSHKFIDNESISGFINFENLTIENSEKMKKSYSIFENFIFNHSNQTVKSAFVFQGESYFSTPLFENF